MATAQAQEDAKMEMRKRRQDIAKETLALNNRARAAFIQMQCEPDERKIVKMMTDLGFDMPKLPERQDGEGGEEQKAGF
ncbi:unnamed protein product [Polarella glacialis]|uniref:Uncharacterized protein n=1 Tax=Polarella glacialis TaxID=89957 RepID=A0A813L3D1_POLGL|nr:unnamed protein product [Polarella glacialis]